MSNEIYRLTGEIKRLRMLLDVVTEKLVETTARLSAYDGSANPGNNLNYPTLNDNIGVKSELSSTLNNNIGVKSELSSTLNDNIGVKSELSSILNDNIGVKSELSSILNDNIGVKSELSSTLNNNMGVKSELSSTLNNNIGVKSELSSTPNNNMGVKSALPDHVESNVGVKSCSQPPAITNSDVKPVNVSWVVSGLRPHMFKCRETSIHNAAKILMQLYAAPRNSHKTLRHLVGLSEDGMTKHIMAMKKRGLIVRTAFQEYTLTGKALEILEQARQ